MGYNIGVMARGKEMILASLATLVLAAGCGPAVEGGQTPGRPTGGPDTSPSAGPAKGSPTGPDTSPSARPGEIGAALSRAAKKLATSNPPRRG